jgi:hypothetical protein
MKIKHFPITEEMVYQFLGGDSIKTHELVTMLTNMANGKYLVCDFVCNVIEYEELLNGES